AGILQADFLAQQADLLLQTPGVGRQAMGRLACSGKGVLGQGYDVQQSCLEGVRPMAGGREGRRGGGGQRYSCLRRSGAVFGSMPEGLVEIHVVRLSRSQTKYKFGNEKNAPA